MQPGRGNQAMINRGSLRAEKVICPPDDKVWCCLWRDGVGMCLDFLEDDLDDVIALLQELKDEELEVFEDD